jgi:hypothetical protein
MEKNEEEMKEVKEQIAKIEKEIDIIRAIFGKYSSQRWEFLRHTSSFQQEVEPEFHQFSSYSFDELKQEKSKLQEEKTNFWTKKFFYFRNPCQVLNLFIFSQLMIFKILTFKYSYEFMFCHVQQFQVHQQVKYYYVDIKPLNYFP